MLEPNVFYSEAMRSVAYWNKALRIANWIGLLFAFLFLCIELKDFAINPNSYALIGFTFRAVGMLVHVVGLKTAKKTDSDSAKCYLYWVSINAGIFLFVLVVTIVALGIALLGIEEPMTEDAADARTWVIIAVLVLLVVLLVTCAISCIFILIACKAYNSRKVLESASSMPQYSEQAAYAPYVQGVPMRQLAV